MEHTAEMAAGGSTIRTRGRGWLRRHWTGLTGLFMYVVVAVADAAGVVYASRDWFELFVWGSVAGLLVALWFTNGARRDLWKAGRRATPSV